MTAYYNEIDPYCCRVLDKNIRAGHLPYGVIDDRDIRDVRADELVGFSQLHLFAGIGGFPLACRMVGLPDTFGIVTGGFPCQDISKAGRGAGIDGERSGLWAEMVRLIGELRPRYALMENVSMLLARGLGRVLGDLAACGFDAEWSVVSACSVGAPHTRERVFIVAYPHCVGCQARDVQDRVVSEALAQAAREGQWQFRIGRAYGRRVRAIPNAGVCRVADGVPGRLDRYRAVGNAVVPEAACVPLRRILAMEGGAA